MKGAARQRRPSRIWLLTATSLYCRRDKSRALRGGGVAGWTPLSGVSLRPSGRTPPGSRKNCQTSSDHLLSLVLRRLANPTGGMACLEARQGYSSSTSGSGASSPSGSAASPPASYAPGSSAPASAAFAAAASATASSSATDTGPPSATFAAVSASDSTTSATALT